MDKVSVFQITEYNSRVQIQPLPLNKVSYLTGFFFIYIRCPTRRLLCCGILLHILIIFLFGIPCGYSVFSFQIKRQRNFLVIYTNILQKSSQFPHLLQILEHAFSLLVEFSSIHKTTCYITIWAKLLCSNNTFHCN